VAEGEEEIILLPEALRGDRVAEGMVVLVAVELPVARILVEVVEATGTAVMLVALG